MAAAETTAAACGDGDAHAEAVRNGSTRTSRNGGNAALIETCHNVTVSGGTIAGPGDIRITARPEFADTSDTTFEDLTLSDTAFNENPCAVNTVLRGITWGDSQHNSC